MKTPSFPNVVAKVRRSRAESNSRSTLRRRRAESAYESNWHPWVESNDLTWLRRPGAGSTGRGMGVRCGSRTRLSRVRIGVPEPTRRIGRGRALPAGIEPAHMGLEDPVLSSAGAWETRVGIEPTRQRVATVAAHQSSASWCSRRESNPLSLVGIEACCRNTSTAWCALRESSPRLIVGSDPCCRLTPNARGAGCGLRSRSGRHTKSRGL